MSLNILITGSSGFLGSQLCKVLSNTNHKVIGVDITKPIYNHDCEVFKKNKLTFFCIGRNIFRSKYFLFNLIYNNIYF